MTKRHLNDGWDLRRGSITGTQPGLAEKLDDPPGKVKRRRRSDYKRQPEHAARTITQLEPPAIPEWDNPYLKRKMDKGTALHLAALRRSRELAASDPEQPVDRAAIIRRDDKTCWICKKRLQVKEIELDHVVPLVRGGKHVAENLRVSCRSCNAWHGSRLVQPL